MNIAQEVNLGKTDVEREVEKAANDLIGFVNQAFQTQRPLHEIELGIWQHVLKLGHEAMQMLFSLHGDGSVGEQIELDNGQTAKRLPDLHTRVYVSVFGNFKLNRAVYGSREGQAIECVPLDIRLALPAPPPKEEGPILVVSGDGKGVPIRRPADAPRIDEHRSQRGPKKDRKRMAIVGAAYTIDPYVRTAEEVVDALFRAPAEERPESRRPEPCHKRVCTSLTLESDNEDESRDAMATVFGWLAEQQQARNPLGQKTVVAVMDGQESLWESLHFFQPPEPSRVKVIEALDLLHVTPRLWRAAHLFHPVKSKAADQFVRERLLRILRGEVGAVIRGLRQMGTKRGLHGQAIKSLRTICGYLEDNRERMRYDENLACGYPIAS